MKTITPEDITDVEFVMPMSCEHEPITAEDVTNAADKPIPIPIAKSWFENFAELLGVKLFKKFWIFGGSYWNSSHVNPKDRLDLMNIRANAEENMRAHKSSVVYIIHVLVSLAIYYRYTKDSPNTNSDSIVALMLCTLFGFAWSGYAIMVQYYNILRVNRAESVLKSVSPSLKCPNDINAYVCPYGETKEKEEDPLEGTHFQLSRGYYGLGLRRMDKSPSDNIQIYRVTIRDNPSIGVGGYFANKDNAVEFAKSLGVLTLQEVLNSSHVTNIGCM